MPTSTPPSPCQTLSNSLARNLERDPAITLTDTFRASLLTTGVEYGLRHDLLEVVLALRASSCLSRLLHCGQQQGDEDRNDGDDHEQFDQSKAAWTR